MQLLLLAAYISLPIAVPISSLPDLHERTCTNPVIRPEWRRMRDADKQAYIQAEKCLMQRPSKTGLNDARTRFEDLQAVHQIDTAVYHDNAVFLPWHRYFLNVHHMLLKQECNYTGPIPWWDETIDRGHFERAPVFTNQYFGQSPLANEGTTPPCVKNGAFANTVLHIGPGGPDQNRDHCLSRAINNQNSNFVTQYYVNACNGYTDYNKMWFCVYEGPHAYGHVALEGTMSDVAASPGDPIFYLHHAFVDRNWWAWQKANPKTRLGGIDGHTTSNMPVGGWRDVTLDTEMATYGIAQNVTVAMIMDTKGGYLCYTYDY